MKNKHILSFALVIAIIVTSMLATFATEKHQSSVGEDEIYCGETTNTYPTFDTEKGDFLKTKLYNKFDYCYKKYTNNELDINERRVYSDDMMKTTRNCYLYSQLSYDGPIIDL